MPASSISAQLLFRSIPLAWCIRVGNAVFLLKGTKPSCWQLLSRASTRIANTQISPTFQAVIENKECENPRWMSCQNFANETSHHAVASHLLWVIQLTHCCWTRSLIAILDLKASKIGYDITINLESGITVPLETIQNSWSMKHAVVSCMPLILCHLLVDIIQAPFDASLRYWVGCLPDLSRLTRSIADRKSVV